jgi:hypothetical protein
VSRVLETARHIIPSPNDNITKLPEGIETGEGSPITTGLLEGIKASGQIDNLILILALLIGVLTLLLMARLLIPHRLFEREEYHVIIPSSIQHPALLTLPYVYEGARAKLREIYEKLVATAKNRGIDIQPSTTMAELIKVLGIKGCEGPLKAYYTVMYGECSGCMSLISEAEELDKHAS